MKTLFVLSLSLALVACGPASVTSPGSSGTSAGASAGGASGASSSSSNGTSGSASSSSSTGATSSSSSSSTGASTSSSSSSSSGGTSGTSGCTCAGKCAGADDGCGGTCTTNSCTGCCAGTVCNAGTDTSACGANGGACIDCGAQFPEKLCRSDATCGPSIGTNLSGMEWTAPSLRYGQSTVPNLNFTVPRSPNVTWLAANGFTRNRLPIQWELLQPMLNTTSANATVRAAVGEPGALHDGYASYITDVLNAHAAAGTKVILDLHNYCRYQDFVYQADGSVSGLVVPSDPLIRPYTTDGSQVQVRICATAPGATLTKENLADFWTRVATKWKGHPGLAGYGLMNEPHDLPAPGGTTPSYGNEDLTIWPTFAQAAVDAIRAVDPTTPIYVSSNGWDAAMGLATQNPGFPLQGTHLIYEVHMYLDASSSGYAFDYDTEVAKGYSAGLGGVPIDANTGMERLKMATDWGNANGVPVALTEVGMPLDDLRWQTEFQNAVDFARQQGVEVYAWMGGNHWPIQNYAMNMTPGWHQDRTLEPSASGPLKQSAGISQFTLYDDGDGYAPVGSSATVTLYARGNLASPLTVTVSSSNGGSFSKTTLTIPAGANGEDSFTFSPASEGVVTLSYTRSDGGQVPPARKVYALADPVAYASTNLADAASAILAKYHAAQWNLADGYTDYLQGRPANDGEVVRAVSESGFGSSDGNALEMLNWLNKENSASSSFVPPLMRVVNGLKTLDVSAPDTVGLWCKKTYPLAGIQPNPRNRVPFDLADAHFVLAAVSVPGPGQTGVVFQASRAEDVYTSELDLSNGQPQAQWIDSTGQNVSLTSSSALTPGTPAVIGFTTAPGYQTLRVNSVVAGSASASFANDVFNQMLIGWGFLSYYPRASFGGNVYAVMAGKGAPTAAELHVLEQQLATTAGFSL